MPGRVWIEPLHHGERVGEGVRQVTEILVQIWRRGRLSVRLSSADIEAEYTRRKYVTKLDPVDYLDCICRFGPLEKVQVVLDGHSGRSRGFAFVYFENQVS